MRKITLLAALLAAPLCAPDAALAQETSVRVAPASRGMIGIFSESVTINGATEIRIRDVVPGSPAALAGIVRGDVVIRIDGQQATAELLRRPREPGETVRLRLRRDSGERDVEIVTADRGRNVYVVPAIPDSVLGQMAIIMSNVRTQLDSIGRITGHIDMDSLRIVVPDSLRRMSIARDSLARFFLRADSAAWRFPEGGTMQVYRRANVDSLRAHFDSMFVHLEATRPAMESFYRFGGDSARGWVVRPSDIVRTTIFTGISAMAGADLSELNPGLAEYFGTAEGVLVLNVPEGTPAARAGLRPGDIIHAVNGTPVRSISDIRRAAPAPGTTITVGVFRKGERLELKL